MNTRKTGSTGKGEIGNIPQQRAHQDTGQTGHGQTEELQPQSCGQMTFSLVHNTLSAAPQRWRDQEPQDFQYSSLGLLGEVETMPQQRTGGVVQKGLPATLGKAQSNPLSRTPQAPHSIPKRTGGLFRMPCLFDIDSETSLLEAIPSSLIAPQSHSSQKKGSFTPWSPQKTCAIPHLAEVPRGR